MSDFLFSTLSLSADSCSQCTPLIPTVGTGNGQLMFAFSSAGYTSLTGIDYSPLSIQLAQSILESRLSSSSSESTTTTTQENEDDEEESYDRSQPKLSNPPPKFFTADILEVALGNSVSGVTGEKWELITDKGTYDAVCLSDETREGKRLQDLYVESIAKLLEKGGIFLITSCKSSSPLSGLAEYALTSPIHAQVTGLKRNWKRLS